MITCALNQEKKSMARRIFWGNFKASKNPRIDVFEVLNIWIAGF